MMKQRFILCIIILLFLSGTMADAETNNSGYGSITDYLNSIYGADPNAGLTAFPVLKIPMGGRAEGMAGAFSAVSDDISFIEFNPAGSSMLTRSGLAVFHNNWIADTKIEGAVFASRFKDLGFAAAGKWLYTPFTEYNMYGERASKGYYSEGVAILNISYNFFKTYYFPGLSVGANIKGAFRILPDFSDADDMGNNEGQIVTGSGLSQSAFMVMADVGLLTRFNFLKFYNSREPNTSAAVVMRNLGPLSMKEALPSVITAAIAYKPLKPLLVSFDFSVPLNFQDISLSEKPYWSLGIAGDVTRFLSLRTGLMGKAGNVRISIGSSVNLAKLSLEINYTLDLMTQIQPLNRVSLGMRFDLGDQGRSTNAARAEELYLKGLDAYANSDLSTARSCWEEALRLDPHYTPAKEGLNIIYRTQQTEDRIRDMQKLYF